MEPVVVDSGTVVHALGNVSTAHDVPSLAVASSGPRYDFSMPRIHWHSQCSSCVQSVAATFSTCHHSVTDARCLSVDKT